ncbi:isochorismate synthase [Planctomonas psychrotolerans]|uniref:isochorismate synthase n=1 Tax=Planctomonas psychrotolerans TaxID=2528712 RepID=UPI001D0D3177|nr:chorismate-binding protein [Planctomonas psychrotolerans]
MTVTQARALIAESTLIDRRLDPLTLLDGMEPLLWLRDGVGIAGVGTTLRLEFGGATRMTDAAAAWRELVAGSTVVDPVGVPGSGLVAFGAFAFAASSASTSVLLVPEIVVGMREGVSWVTRIRLDDDARDEAGRLPGNAAFPLGKGSVGTPTPTPHPTASGFAPGAMTEDGYRRAVREALERIEAGDVSKVVLARDLTADLAPTADLRPVLSDLATAYPDCWTFAVDGLVGASPETLVRVAGGRVSARVLAGTAARGSDAAADRRSIDDLVASAKDAAEHGFALDSAVAALEPHSDDLTSSRHPFPLRLPNLWHLASDLEGTLRDGSSSLDLLDGLHPTAAVAGTPTGAALTLIERAEPFDRGRYAGPVGWVGADGEGEWAVALRCAQVDPGGTVTAYAGAGIVAGSDPDRELAETELKFRPMRDAFARPVADR